LTMEHRNPDLDSPQIQATLRGLKAMDFELAYLAALTSCGLKPLSRWEKRVSDRVISLLNQTGLLVDQIRRTVKTGKEVVETVFSLSPAYIQLYKQRFNNCPIDKSPDTQRFEGFLFGYPPCCVDQYIRRAYAPNELPEEDQKILFHWSCKDCQITPTLLPAYKSIHNSLENQ